MQNMEIEKEVQVSVIVPNYNYARYLPMRIESILNQTFTDFELILLDDASTDESVSVLEKYRNNKHVSHIVVNEQNTGSPFQQWMKGISLSRGKYIWIAEADDLAEPDFLETCINSTQQAEDVSICYTGSLLIDNTGQVLRKDVNHWGHRKAKANSCFNGVLFATHNLYWKNYIINASGAIFSRQKALTLLNSSFKNMHYCGDWLFWFEMAMKGQVIEIYKNLNYFRQHPTKVTENSRKAGEGIKEDILIVKHIEDILKEDAGSEDYHKVLSLFGIEELLPKKLIFLSSGELRKFLIVRTLLKHPRVLILDNPFIGLDAPSRGVLVEMLQQITKLKCVQVVLLLSNPDDIPEMITHVLPVKQRKCLPVYSREEFLKQTDLIVDLFPFEGKEDSVRSGAFSLPVGEQKEPSAHLVTFRMEHVSIKYGNRTILKDLDWEVRNGEKWALFGPNGAGKSTLLSLIYADNPQSYANTLYLFDRKRGSGESIWDIKKRIGYVSPEMHLFYMENVPVLNIVSSGFFDSIGLFRKCTERQQQVALAWMRVFGIEELKDRSFLTLSSGEQRLALLARAFVKDPDLIILDEPLHGLDVSNKKKVAAIIEQFCSRPGKTLIYVTHYPHELPACVDKRFELVKHA